MGDKQKQKKYLDGLSQEKNILRFVDFPLSRYILKYKKASTWFSKAGKTSVFFTDDSKLYYTPEEYSRIQKGERIVRITRRFDSLQSREFEKNRIYSIGEIDLISLNIRRRYSSIKNYLSDLVRGSIQGVSVAKMWNLSIVGAIIFGMFTMTMVYRYLGQGVAAKIIDSQPAVAAAPANNNLETPQEINKSIDTATISKLMSSNSNSAFEKQVTAMVKGYPIEKMLPEIFKQNKAVASFIIAIAKQESDWGVHAPVYNGQDCYNYWGYKGDNRIGTGGHSCFSSPKEAVDTVAKRIQFLVADDKLDTPSKMVVWKCGYSCSWDNPKNDQQWISNVSFYFSKLNGDQN